MPKVLSKMRSLFVIDLFTLHTPSVKFRCFEVLGGFSVLEVIIWDQMKNDVCLRTFCGVLLHFISSA